MLASVVPANLPLPQHGTSRPFGRYIPLPVPRVRAHSALSRVDMDSAKVESSNPHAIVVSLLISPLSSAPRTGVTSPMLYPRASAMTPAHGARRAGMTPPVHFSVDFEPTLLNTSSRIVVAPSGITPVAGVIVGDYGP